MIQITDNHNCCGCSACVQRCPIQSISMWEDEEGFLYPKVDSNTCVDCRICETVCPVLNQSAERNPIGCFAAFNPNEDVRSISSSGGIFIPLASAIINDGGVVFGARYDMNWDVFHSSATTLDEIKAFRGSKYVQSRIGNIFIEVERILKEGRKVLFSGTPCQVAGLKKYLRKEYDQLLTIDIVCHGAPSPKIWREYIKHLPMNGVTEVRMKDKSTGWREYSFSLFDASGLKVFSERASSNKYLLAFFQNLTLRPSCFNCPSKAGKSGSDITLADFWGIEKMMPAIDDNKGASLICANTVKGKSLIQSIDIPLNNVKYDRVIPYNVCISQSTTEPTERIVFWENYKKQGIQVLMSMKAARSNIIKRIIKKILR